MHGLLQAWRGAADYEAAAATRGSRCSGFLDRPAICRTSVHMDREVPG